MRRGRGAGGAGLRGRCTAPYAPRHQRAESGGIGGIAPDVQGSSRDCPAYRFRCSFASGAGFVLVVLSWSAHLFATSEKPMFAGVLVVLRGGVACLQSRGGCAMRRSDA